MLFWFPLTTLMIDAMQVIEMRLRLIAGGKGTPEEIFLMMNEKIDALTQASTILARGGNSGQIIDNTGRLSRPMWNGCPYNSVRLPLLGPPGRYLREARRRSCFLVLPFGLVFVLLEFPELPRVQPRAHQMGRPRRE